jgi:hypothetical protein
MGRSLENQIMFCPNYLEIGCMRKDGGRLQTLLSFWFEYLDLPPNISQNWSVSLPSFCDLEGLSGYIIKKRKSKKKTLE